MAEFGLRNLEVETLPHGGVDSWIFKGIRFRVIYTKFMHCTLQSNPLRISEMKNSDLLNY